MVTLTNALAEVVIKGKTVGAVFYDQNKQVATFEYSEEWLDTGYSISPLHLPLTKQIYQFPYLNKETYHGLPGALADTLPDDFGNAVINAWLARQGRNVASFSPVERLLYTGTRGMGALEFLPQIRDQLPTPVDLNVSALVDLTQQVLDTRSKLDVTMSTEGLAEIVQVGTSAGGARPKAVVGLNKDKTHVLSGQLDLPAGYKHYLIKFDGVKERRSESEIFGDPAGYGRLEYAYFLAATAAGINMMPCELLEESGRAHFLTERFDREGNDKHHFQSLCAMAHADFRKPGLYSYEQVFSVMRELLSSFTDAVEFMRRMVFNVMFRNQDDHTKNFGFLYDPDTRRWRLSPAFDVAWSYSAESYWTKQHNMSINGKVTGITYDDLKACVASSPRLSAELPGIVETMREVRNQLPGMMEKTGVPDFLQKAVIASLRNI